MSEPQKLIFRFREPDGGSPFAQGSQGERIGKFGFSVKKKKPIKKK